MAKIFRTLLVAAVNAIKEFLAFATPECLEPSLINADIIGELNNEDGVFSGFSSSSYLQSTFVPDLTKPFTFIMKFKQNSTISYNWLFATTGSEHKGFACFINSSNKLFLSCGNASGNSWQIDEAGVSVLSNNQDYWLKYTFDGTSTHNLYLSTTGEFNGEETTEFTKTDGSGIYSASSLLLGHNYSWNGNHYFDGSIDMKETSITIDGQTTIFYSTIPEVGNTINLNDGMATSNYDWSAYPVGVKNGTYTQTGTVEQIKQIGGDTVYVTDEPEQDNKEVSIKAGEVYYAYTNENDSSDTLYTTDDPIIAKNFVLENAQIIQTLSPKTIINNYGVISGFEANYRTGGNYVLVTTPDYSNTQINSFDIAFFFKTGDTINTYERIVMDSTTQEAQKTFLIRMNNGSYEFVTSPENGVAVISSPSTNTNYGIRATYNGTTVQTYYYDFINNTWVASNSYQPSSVQFNNNTYSVGVRAQDFYDGCVFKGSVDLSKSYIEINNTKTTFGYLSIPSTLYENTGTTIFTPTALDPQPSFTIPNIGLINATEEGTLTNNNGVYSGFNSSSYLQSTFIPDLTKEYEIIIPIYVTEHSSSERFFFATAASEHNGLNMMVKNGKLFVAAGIGSSWIDAYYGTTDLQLNKWYWVKATYDGVNAYAYYTSDTGAFAGEEILELQATSTGKITSVAAINFGRSYPWNGSTPFYGSIDMKNTSITIDGQTTNFYNTKSCIVIENDLYERNSTKDEVKSIPGLTINIETVDNTTINTVTVSTPTQGYEDVNYYAYTNENDNTEKVYITNNPVSGIFWENKTILDSNGTLGGDSPACAASHQNQPAWYAFDGDISRGDRCWWTRHGETSISNPCWITYYTPVAVKLNYVYLYNETETPASPKTGVIQGSNNNLTWTDLAEIHVASNESGLKTTVQVNATSVYNYFRFYFTESWSSAGVAIQEIKLFGNEGLVSELYEKVEENKFEKLDPQPNRTVYLQGLNNCTNTNCEVVSEGVYQGGSGKYILTNNVPALQTADNWEIKLKMTYNGGSTSPTIIGSSDSSYWHAPCMQFLDGLLKVSITSNGSSWFVNGGATTCPATVGATYYIKYGFETDPNNEGKFQYYVWWSTVGWNDANATKDIIKNNTTERQYCSAPLVFLNMYGNRESYTGYYYCNGNIDLTETSITTNNNTTIFYSSAEKIVTNTTTYERYSQDDEIVREERPTFIETSTNLTTSNNDNVITDGVYHLFNMTVPTGLTPYIQSNGIAYQLSEMPLLLKNNSGLSILLKDGNNIKYRNTRKICQDYNLHYQQVTFTTNVQDPTIIFRIENAVESSPYYCYCGDNYSYTIIKEGYVNYEGSGTIGYSSKDGNIINIEANLTPSIGTVDIPSDYTYTIDNTGNIQLTNYIGGTDTTIPNITEE